MFAVKRYDIVDAIDYQPMVSNVHQSRWNIPSAVSSASIFGYNANGWKFGNASSYSRIIHQTSLTAPFSVEFTLPELFNDGLIQYIYSNGTTPNAGIVINAINNTITICGNSYNYNFVANDKFRIEWNNGNCKVYKNDVLFGEGTHSVSFPTNVEFHASSNRYCRIKDLIIKPL